MAFRAAPDGTAKGIRAPRRVGCHPITWSGAAKLALGVRPARVNRPEARRRKSLQSPEWLAPERGVGARLIEVSEGRSTWSGLETVAMQDDSLLPKLRELAQRAAEPLGIEVAWVELKQAGGSRLFRVFIDREEGVGLEECERVNERLSVLLDVEDPIESSYTLEVSTPGLDRPLWTMKDYERFTGRVAKIKTREQLDGKNRFRGRLVGVEGESVLLEQSGERKSIPFPIIESARLEVELFLPEQRQFARQR